MAVIFSRLRGSRPFAASPLTDYFSVRNRRVLMARLSVRNAYENAIYVDNYNSNGLMEINQPILIDIDFHRCSCIGSAVLTLCNFDTRDNALSDVVALLFPYANASSF